MMTDTANYHGLHDLFAQLGLPNDNASIHTFIHTHRPLPNHIILAKASWWTPGQASFITEAIAEDADWAIAVDVLDTLLREHE